MRLYQLAYCCRLYAQVTNFDASIDKLRHTGGESLNLLDEEHARALLRWLNSWGCRQFAIEYHEPAAKVMAQWWLRWRDKLPPAGAKLGQLDASSLDTAAHLYGELASLQASKRRGRNEALYGDGRSDWRG